MSSTIIRDAGPSLKEGWVKTSAVLAFALFVASFFRGTCLACLYAFKSIRNQEVTLSVATKSSRKLMRKAITRNSLLIKAEVIQAHPYQGIPGRHSSGGGWRRDAPATSRVLFYTGLLNKHIKMCYTV